MKRQYIALCSLLLAFLALAVSAEPECPQVRCTAPRTNVACFIGERKCGCVCVGTPDPCDALLKVICPQNGSVSCNRNGNECRCRCIRERATATSTGISSPVP